MSYCKSARRIAPDGTLVIGPGGSPHLPAAVIDHPANVSIVRSVFPLQSFFHSTQLQNGLAVQDPNDPIVASTRNSRQIKGRMVGLHPASQTPVALRIMTRGDSSGSDLLVMSPGQVLRVKAHGFYGIEWGLPFGWLGGGLAQLVFADNEDAFVSWPKTRPEVLVHRERVQIIADANPSTTPLVSAANWPVRFPWTNAFRSATAGLSSQRGSPLFAPEMTRVRFRLRVNNLSAPAQMRVIMQGIDDFDLGTDGETISFTDFSYQDLSWPQATGSSTPYPIIEVLDGILLDGGDQAVATFSNLGNSELTNQYVDVCRYGRL